ncbi:amidohydrolase family protein [Rhodobacteraceae bacterium MCCB 386]|nr:amidohydrolase family protein [Roseitranquillus sediminis]
MPDSNSPPVEIPEAESTASTFPRDRPKEPTVRAPVGACDCHLHMVAGPAELPMVDRRADDPVAGHGFEGWMGLLRVHLDAIGCTRGVVVQSVIYGADNHVTIEAVRRLGEQFRGVALVTDEVQDGTLDHLSHHRMKAVRVNRVHGGPLNWEGAEALAPRLADRGMHIEMLIHADRDLPALADRIAALPVPVVIDHCGWPSSAEMSGEGIDALCRLVQGGQVWVKLSGLYRFTPRPHLESDDLVRRLVEANPGRCVWGSDWPHLLLGEAEMPDAGVLFDAFTRVVEDTQTRQRILVDNPATLYGF